MKCKPFLCILLCVFTAVTFTCDIPIVSQEPGEVPYRTDHFVIYYDPAMVSFHDIEQFCYRNEERYVQINDYLNVSYDGVIEIFLSDITHDTRLVHGQLQMSYYRFFHPHQGQNIAQVILTQTWGYLPTGALRDGLCYASLFSSGTAFNSFKMNLGSNHTKVVDWEIGCLIEDFCHEGWSGYESEYERAGAFIHYLIHSYGLKKLKKWYRQCVGEDPGSACLKFKEIYLFSLDDAGEEFRDVLRDSNVYAGIFQ